MYLISYEYMNRNGNISISYDEFLSYEEKVNIILDSIVEKHNIIDRENVIILNVMKSI